MTQPFSAPFRKILIANRGEIAVRIARAAADLGMSTVGLYSTDDIGAPHWRQTNEAIALSRSGAAAYLDIEAVIAAAISMHCDAIHPGYGFLAENPFFARRCDEAGLSFIGPRAETLALLGDKTKARELAIECGIPVAQGRSEPVSLEEAEQFMHELGPDAEVMLKAVAGGGGRGMRRVASLAELSEAYRAAHSEALATFGNGKLYVEQLIAPARHIEIQVLGDTAGNVTHLHERECSLQRRHQKLVEFAPSPFLSESLRERITQAATVLAARANVHTLCTMEFLVGPDDAFFFMEANPRLQVEHTVTEAITGVDLVQTQFWLAAGRRLTELGLDGSPPAPHGLAVQLRINMERIDAAGRAVPAAGTIKALDVPGGPGVRVDTGARSGWTPSSNFDSLLAKLIVHTPSKKLDDLLSRARRALAEFHVDGPATNTAFLHSLLADADVAAGRFHTCFVEEHGERFAAEMVKYQPERPLTAAGGEPPESISSPPEAWVPDGLLVVRAPLGGVVARVSVQPGDIISRGEVVGAVESMKMEYSIVAEEPGRVVSLQAEPGQTVHTGSVVLHLSPRDVEGTEDPLTRQQTDAIATEHLNELRERKVALLDSARPDAVARQRKRDALTARERIARLCDKGSFVEIGGLVADAGGKIAPADALVVGTARIDGRPVVILSQDFTVIGGSNGPLGRSKMVRMLQLARTNGMPVVQLLDGGGHRIQEGQNSRSYAGSTPTFQEYAYLSGWVPMVSAVLGAGFAANTNFCAMADLVIMVRGLSEMGLAGPTLVKAGTGESISGQELGGASIQVDQNGLADLAVDTEDEAFESIRRFLSFLPSNARAPIPHATAITEPCGDDLPGLVPTNTRVAYDMREVVKRIADEDSIFEIKPSYGTNIVTAFARLAGRSIGVIGNQPLYKGGMIDSAASEKAARFIAICDAYGLPLVYLIDVPGMSIGSEAERTVLGRRSAKLLWELGHATVPRASVVVRKGYGLGYVAMCGGRGFKPDTCLAWPSAEICAMSIEGSVDVAFRKQYIDKPDPVAARRDLIDGIRAKVNPILAAEGFGIDDVVEPSETRSRLIAAFEHAPLRRQSEMPPKYRSIPPI